MSTSVPHTAALFLAVFTAHWFVAELQGARRGVLTAGSLIIGVAVEPALLVLAVASTVALEVCTRFAARQLPAMLWQSGGILIQGVLVALLCLDLSAIFADGLWLPITATEPSWRYLAAGLIFLRATSYLVDIGADQEAFRPHFLDLFLFIAFFPMLFGSPLIRSREFWSQLAATPQLDTQQVTGALWSIVCGWVKIALLAAPLYHLAVHPAFSAPGFFGAVDLSFATLTYGVFLYCQLSGLFDLTRGVASLFGVDLPIGFDAPFASGSLNEFWQRWHCTLTHWLRDYLYQPIHKHLGGNQLPLIATMSAAGLCYGLDPRFAAWGAIHGVALAWALPRRHPCPKYLRVLRFPSTIGLVSVAWLVFATPSLSHLADLLSAWQRSSPELSLVTPYTVALTICGATLGAVPLRLIQRLNRSAARVPLLVQAVAAGCLLGLGFAWSGGDLGLLMYASHH